jgi:hypothetical protein
MYLTIDHIRSEELHTFCRLKMQEKFSSNSYFPIKDHKLTISMERNNVITFGQRQNVETA